MPKRSTSDALEFTNDEIVAIVKEIRDGEAGNRERVFRRKYPEFAERFTSLFSMVCAPSFDMGCLVSMLALRDRIQTDKMSLDNASKVVGQNLYDKFVADKIVDQPPE